MAKPPRRPGKPTRSGRRKAGAEAGAMLANPWARLIAETRDAVLRESIEQGHYETVLEDGQLLAECATVERVNQKLETITEDELEHILLHASVRRPYTLAGWRAKVQLALFMIQLGREPDQAPDDYERMIPWLVLQDVLKMIDGLDPESARKRESKA